MSAPCTLPSSQPADGTFLLHCTPRPANISTTPNKSNRNRQDVCSLHFRDSGSSSTNPDSLSTVWIFPLFFPSIPYEVPPPGPTKTRGTTPLQAIFLHPKKLPRTNPRQPGSALSSRLVSTYRIAFAHFLTVTLYTPLGNTRQFAKSHRRSYLVSPYRETIQEPSSTTSPCALTFA